jgi:ribosomal protein S18 acetylase RimI-like enzyme
MNSPVFRLAVVGDAALVQAISATAYKPAYLAVVGFVPKPAVEDYSDRIAQENVWLAELDGEPRGVLVLEPSPTNLVIYSIAVLPCHQGVGLGKALMAFAELRARKMGFSEIGLYTNRKMTKNVSLYQACGFTEITRRPHPSRPGEFLVDMVKKLQRN